MSAPFAAPSSDKRANEEGEVLAPRFDAAGLVTAVVTDFESGLLLMVAHMDAEALRLSADTGIAHYFSRSRGKLWKKGETSGAFQHIREMRVDCDQDAVWLRVSVDRPEETCHTHRSTCFYRRVADGPEGPRLETIDEVHRLSD